jgi:hypothetical protein
MCEKEYDCSEEWRLSGSRRVQGNRPPSQERTASRSLNNLWVQKSFARAPSSTLDDRERRRSGEHGGAALAFEASWHDAPNTTESSGDNAPTLQMIDMMVGHKILQACGRAYRCSPCAIAMAYRRETMSKEGLSMVLSLYLGNPLGTIFFQSLDKLGGAFEEPFLRLEDRTRPMRR